MRRGSLRNPGYTETQKSIFFPKASHCLGLFLRLRENWKYLLRLPHLCCSWPSTVQIPSLGFLLHPLPRELIVILLWDRMRLVYLKEKIHFCPFFLKPRTSKFLPQHECTTERQNCESVNFCRNFKAVMSLVEISVCKYVEISWYCRILVRWCYGRNIDGKVFKIVTR